MGKKQNQQHRK